MMNRSWNGPHWIPFCGSLHQLSIPQLRRFLVDLCINSNRFLLRIDWFRLCDSHYSITLAVWNFLDSYWNNGMMAIVPDSFKFNVIEIIMQFWFDNSISLPLAKVAYVEIFCGTPPVQQCSQRNNTVIRGCFDEIDDHDANVRISEMRT